MTNTTNVRQVCREQSSKFHGKCFLFGKFFNRFDEHNSPMYLCLKFIVVKILPNPNDTRSNQNSIFLIMWMLWIGNHMFRNPWHSPLIDVLGAEFKLKSIGYVSSIYVIGMCTWAFRRSQWSRAQRVNTRPYGATCSLSRPPTTSAFADITTGCLHGRRADPQSTTFQCFICVIKVCLQYRTCQDDHALSRNVFDEVSWAVKPLRRSQTFNGTQLALVDLELFVMWRVIGQHTRIA